MKTKILVTGGSGYLGSHLCKKLYQMGYEVYILDSCEPKHTYYKHYYLIDIRSGDIINAFNGNDYEFVFHLAGRIEVGESQKDPIEFWHVNVGGTVNLLNAMKKLSKAKLIFSSTAGVYWSVGLPIPEYECTTNNSVYSNTKIASETAIQDSKIPYVIFRYFNLAGADPDGEMGETHDPETHMIPCMFQNIDNFKIYGNDYRTPDGTCIRDYVHVCDVVDAHISAMQYLNDGHPPEIINLGSGKGHSILDVIHRFEDLFAMKVNYDFSHRRSGDPDVLIADIGLAKELLDYTPKHNIDSIIKSAYEWYKKHHPKH